MIRLTGPDAAAVRRLHDALAGHGIAVSLSPWGRVPEADAMPGDRWFVLAAVERLSELPNFVAADCCQVEPTLMLAAQVDAVVRELRWRAAKTSR